jgi:hypothetical protein
MRRKHPCSPLALKFPCRTVIYLKSVDYTIRIDHRRTVPLETFVVTSIGSDGQGMKGNFFVLLGKKTSRQPCDDPSANFARRELWQHLDFPFRNNSVDD